LTRAEMRKLCDKHGWVFVEEDDPDNPILREGTRIWFPADSARSTPDASETKDDPGFLREQKIDDNL